MEVSNGFDVLRAADHDTPDLRPAEWLTGSMAHLWAQALGGESLARRLRVAGVDIHGYLHVTCSRTPYRTHLRLLAQHIVTRLNELVPAARVTGIRTHLRPVEVLVSTVDTVTDHQVLADILLETRYDAAQVWGPEHPVILRHTAQTHTDRFVADWAAQHTAATAGTSAPVRAVAELADHECHGVKAVETRDLQLVTIDRPDMCLAICAKGYPIPPIAQLAIRVGLPVRQVWS
ncbi:DciA family protein [Streptomyces sp. NPDC001732]